MHTEFNVTPHGKLPLENLRRTWENNIKITLRKVGCKDRRQV
jgi:hypothetical protein